MDRWIHTYNYIINVRQIEYIQIEENQILFSLGERWVSIGEENKEIMENYLEKINDFLRKKTPRNLYL